jgi:hypothetical protein
MKKYIRYIPALPAATALLVLAALLGSCVNPLDTPDTPAETVSGGKGRLAIRVEEGARTVLPSEPFDRYILRFEYTGETGDYVHEPVEWSAGLSVDLEPGNWTVYADAYSGEFISGTGSAAGTVSAGTVAPVVIRIGINPDPEIRGVLRYTVNYPAEDADHGYGIRHLVVFDTTDAPVEVLDNPVDVINGTPGTLTLPPGVYAVRVIVEDTIQRTSASVSAVAHIYGGQETSLEFTFTAAQFTAHVPLTVTAGLRVPGGVTVTGRKIAVYGDEGCADLIDIIEETPASSGDLELAFWIPSVYEAAYLLQEIVAGGISYRGNLSAVAIDAAGPVSGDAQDAYYAALVDPAMVNGTVVPDWVIALPDTLITLRVTPQPGFILKAGSLNYNDGSDHPLAGSDYSFAMPEADVTIGAFFNRVLGFAIEGPQDEMIAVAVEHSGGLLSPTDASPGISWSGDESLTFRVDAAYSVENGNLMWIVKGEEIPVNRGSSLVIRARDYMPRHYILTVMIKAHDQWYSGEQDFTVVR